MLVQHARNLRFDLEQQVKPGMVAFKSSRSFLAEFEASLAHVSKGCRDGSVVTSTFQVWFPAPTW